MLSINMDLLAKKLDEAREWEGGYRNLADKIKGGKAKVTHKTIYNIVNHDCETSAKGQKTLAAHLDKLRGKSTVRQSDNSKKADSEVK